jgi:phage head maturation protease
MSTLLRSWSTELHYREDDGTLTGCIVPYGVPATVIEHGRRYVEDFAPGSLAGDVGRAGEIELTMLHPRSGRDVPVGITTALQDTPTGLDGEWQVLDTEHGRDALTLVRAKAMRFLSAGFAEVPGGNRWHSRDRVTRTLATLDHVAVVRRGAYAGAMLRTGAPDPLLLAMRLRTRLQ